ncbi:brain and acute leukemia cytoplasmic protein-like isoform X2 [Narcine bancroftii]|uniref:brain and acute leukemia cytoplasmic protein-like isoform X2 n=1 Tax=Narcine bancroftii TaxID=1343680 RepID=UPI00383138B7
MGCGGSRADTIEPRYLESWTRETESTWLTNTDTEAPVVAGAEPRASDNGPDTSEGSTQTHTRVTLCSTGKEKMSTIKRTSTVGTNTHRGKQQLTHVPGATLQKGHIFLTYEKKTWDAKKLSTKEVNIHVAKSIHSNESEGRKMENCVK